MGLALTLVIVGVVLLLIETIVPGMILGIIGFGCVVAGVVITYVRFGAHTGNIMLLCVGGLLTVGVCLWIKYFPRSPVARMFVSNSAIGSLKVEQPELINLEGTAFTDLRPSGTALIQGKRIDVVTEGAFIEKGSAVKVIAVEGMRVVVRGMQIEPREKLKV